jgi:hypothetical protein
MKLKRICLIECHWGWVSGFVMRLFHVSYMGGMEFNGALLGVDLLGQQVTLHAFFIRFVVKLPFEREERE